MSASYDNAAETIAYITKCQAKTDKTCEEYLDLSEFYKCNSSYLSPCDICKEISPEYLQLCENCKTDIQMKYLTLSNSVEVKEDRSKSVSSEFSCGTSIEEHDYSSIIDDVGDCYEYIEMHGEENNESFQVILSSRKRIYFAVVLTILVLATGSVAVAIYLHKHIGKHKPKLSSDTCQGNNKVLKPMREEMIPNITCGENCDENYFLQSSSFDNWDEMNCGPRVISQGIYFQQSPITFGKYTGLEDFNQLEMTDHQKFEMLRPQHVNNDHIWIHSYDKKLWLIEEITNQNSEDKTDDLKQTFYDFHEGYVYRKISVPQILKIDNALPLGVTHTLIIDGTLGVFVFWFDKNVIGSNYFKIFHLLKYPYYSSAAYYNNKFIFILNYKFKTISVIKFSKMEIKATLTFKLKHGIAGNHYAKNDRMYIFRQRRIYISCLQDNSIHVYNISGHLKDIYSNETGLNRLKFCGIGQFGSLLILDSNRYLNKISKSGKMHKLSKLDDKVYGLGYHYINDVVYLNWRLFVIATTSVQNTERSRSVLFTFKIPQPGINFHKHRT